MNVDTNNFENFFIPGGPCISGEYWDIYLKVSGIKGKRILLSNHEGKYDSSLSKTYENIVENVKAELLQKKSGEKINIIAHSFGAWVALSLLEDTSINECLEYLVLVSLPLSTVGNKHALSKIEQITATTLVNNNETFKDYWKAILPLYTASALKPEIVNALTSEVYWEGNQNIALEERELENLLSYVQKDKRIRLISGEADIITPPNKLFNEKLVIGSGHFPMLEHSEKFTETLKSCLSSKHS